MLQTDILPFNSQATSDVDQLVAPAGHSFVEEAGLVSLYPASQVYEVVKMLLGLVSSSVACCIVGGALQGTETRDKTKLEVSQHMCFRYLPYICKFTFKTSIHS